MKLLSLLQIWIQTLKLEVQAISNFFVLGFFSFIDEIVFDFANVKPNPRA
jgi:hypothetical protein